MSQDGQGLLLLQSPVRRQLIEILSNLPAVPTRGEPYTRDQGLTASELGQRVGLHLTTVRFHVDQLVDAGLLVAHDVKIGVGRPRRHYAVDPGRLTSLTEPETYRLLEALLADSFVDAQSTNQPQTAEQAAANWVARNAETVVPTGLPLDPARSQGHFLAKVGALLDVLQVWGYTASVQSRNDGHTVELGLRHCPIRELAESNPAVACGVHRGLIRASMAALGEDDATIGLIPFVEPDLCVAHVTTNHPFTSGEDRS